MELMYPIIILIALASSIAIYFFKVNKTKKYIDGKRVANTKYIRETEYYKSKVMKFKILSRIIAVLFTLTIVITSVLIARPVKIQTNDDDRYNRDIILGLDVSGSQSEVNYEFIQQFRNVLPELQGDRIGIVIFNTAPLVYCPLTDDYDFVDEKLEVIERCLKAVISNELISITSLRFEIDEIFNTRSYSK